MVVSASVEAKYMDCMIYLLFCYPFIAFIVFYVFSRVSYDVDDNFIKIHRRVLKYFSAGSILIELGSIEDIRIYRARDDFLSPWLIWGNVFIRKGVMIILKRRRFIYKKIFITPSDPDDFISQVKHRLNR